MDDGADVSGEHSGQSPGEQSPEGRWLTYDELGRIRGIGRESAVKLVQRKRWRRIPGNDGVARILVPLDWLIPAKEPSIEPSPERSPEPSPDVSSAISVFRAAFETALAAKDNEIIALRAVIEAKDGEIAAVRDRTDGLRQERDNERERADRAEAGREGERARADDLRSTIEDLRTEREVAARELAVAQHDALAAQQAAAKADARTGRAEQGEEAERSRADAINTLLEATQEELAGQRALTDQARAEVQAAQDAATALRQADEARKATGRLRRAWDGWRGR
jgi:hypothetical protein